MNSFRLARTVRFASTTKSIAARRACEALESRTLMCLDHMIKQGPIVEERPDLVNVRASGDANDPADIVWTNRANTTAGGVDDTDGFGARFGTSASIARGVVDAVIQSYERMIGSFNYSIAGQTYSLAVNMGNSGGGFGASASLGTSLGGKPKSGSITMGAGNGSSNANDDNGWFLDPTPFDSSEFLGTIVNAYSGNAGTGSAANGKGDFYTVLAAELTHCVGLFGNALPGWAALTTNTTIVDTAEAGGRGTYWVFDGPSIKHLLTSNNGGSGGSDFGQAIHSAGPGGTQPLLFNGETYVGGQDQGNAVYEFSRRYTVNNLFALMFKDAYNFATVDPARDGTFYSIQNQTTGALTIRGAASSNDTISVTRDGNIIAVSVDIQNDVAGTGALPGAGNLPAFISYYDAATINTITIAPGTGDDSITIGADVQTNFQINGDTGNDTLTIVGNAGQQDIAYTLGGAIAIGANTISLLNTEAIVFDGGDGIDSLTLRGTVNADTINLAANQFSGSSVAVSFQNTEALTIGGLGGADTIYLSSPSVPTLVLADGATDTVNIVETLATAPVSLQTTTGLLNVNVNPDAVGSATVLANTDQTLASLNVFEGGTLDGTGTLTLNNAFNFSGGLIGGSGVLVVGSGASFNVTGTGVKALARSLRSSTTFNLADGTLVVSSGLSGVSAAIVTTDIVLGSTAALDLNDNSLIVDYADLSPIASIGSALANGYAGGAWNGLGIRSSTAATNPGRTIGFGEATTVFSSFPATFAGTSVDSTSVLLRYTIAGDANLDAAVNFDDLLVTAQSYGTSGRTFAEGNFNFDASGNVDFDDLLLLAQQYGSALATAAPLAARTVSSASAAKRKTDRATAIL